MEGVREALVNGVRGPLSADPARRRRPVSTRRAAPGSGARMRLSPTRTASTPTRSSSCSWSRMVEARLADDGLAGGHVGEQLEGALDVDAEVGEVAVVDADQLGIDRLERPLELLVVVHLDEHVEVELGGLRVQRGQRVVLERGDDQQDRVGAGDRGLDRPGRARRRSPCAGSAGRWPRAPRAGRRASRRSCAPR